MDKMASRITSLSIIYLGVYSGADQRKYQSSASLASNAEKCFHLMTSSWRNQFKTKQSKIELHV